MGNPSVAGPRWNMVGNSMAVYLLLSKEVVNGNLTIQRKNKVFVGKKGYIDTLLNHTPFQFIYDLTDLISLMKIGAWVVQWFAGVLGCCPKVVLTS